MKTTVQAFGVGSGIAPLLLAVVFFVCFLSSAHAGLVNWDTLTAGSIPQSGSVTFNDVNHAGYDIVVTTSNLTASLGGHFQGQIPGNSWDIAGTVPSSSTAPSTVTFQFFQTGTPFPDTVPISVTGLDFRFEDAEQTERFANFAYYDPSGTAHILPNTSAVFTGVGAPGIGHNPNGLSIIGTTTSFASNFNILENAAPYMPLLQPGKALQVNLASTPLTGFTFMIYRSVSGGGAVSMDGLGNLQPLNLQTQGSPIPEPGTALFGLALLGFLASARRNVSEQRS